MEMLFAPPFTNFLTNGAAGRVTHKLYFYLYVYDAESQELTATLKNSKTGNAVSNANMVVDINGAKTTLKSNSKGQVVFSTADWAPETYVGTISYGGNSKYNSISAAFKVDI